MSGTPFVRRSMVIISLLASALPAAQASEPDEPEVTTPLRPPSKKSSSPANDPAPDLWKVTHVGMEVVWMPGTAKYFKDDKTSNACVRCSPPRS
ncbi:MAG: hypothetical protein WDO68_24995 [Gammaproteobacteria bacterium]